MPNRPLSPHLSVYRFKYTLLSSILNRATGLALSVGLLILAWWLIALYQGPASYAKTEGVFSSVIFKLVFAGLLFSFVYHLVAGVRHLIWDTGRGMERRQSQRSAWAIGIISVLLTLVLVYWAFFGAFAERSAS